MDKRAWILPTAMALASYRVWRYRARGIVAALGLTPNRRAIVEAGSGAAISIFSVLLIFALASSFGWVIIDGVGSPRSLTNVSTPLVVAFVEELVFRLALLGTLLLWIEAPYALLLSALAFCAAHLGNQHFSALATIYTFMSGVVYGLAFINTDRLWLPVGLHFGWNYAEGRLLGFTLSGGAVTESLVIQHDNGPALWTGEAYGPEGGLLGIAGKLVVLALLFGFLGWRKTALQGKRLSL